MNVLVTGAAGFIGSNLVKRLLKERNDVIGIDNDENKKDVMNGLKGNKHFHMIWGDINNIENYRNKFDDVDIIYHLAAYVVIRDEDVHENIRNTVDGTFRILDLIVNKSIPRLVFASTSSIYGEHAVDRIKEDNMGIYPISHYAAGKIANEAYINSYVCSNSFKAWMFRFANVTGAGQNRGVIYDFLKKLKDSPDELEVLGNGKQTKSFFDVDDCVEGLITIPNKDNNEDVQVYNLGNTETITVGELAKIVCDEAGYSPKIKYTGGNRGWKGDTPHTIIDITKALNVGWEPQYTCEEAIRRTVRSLQ